MATTDLPTLVAAATGAATGAAASATSAAASAQVAANAAAATVSVPSAAATATAAAATASSAATTATTAATGITTQLNIAANSATAAASSAASAVAAAGSVTNPLSTSIVTAQTVAGPVTFSGTITGATSTNTTVVGGHGGAAPVTITSGKIAGTSGQNLQLATGGDGTNFTITGPTVGTLLTGSLNATTGSVMDWTAGVGGTTIKSQYNWVNGSYAFPNTRFQASAQPLAMVVGVSGTVTPEAGGNYPISRWTTTADTIDVGTANFVNFFDIVHQWGGAAMTGGRQTFNVHLLQTAQTGNGSNDVFHQAANFTADASFNEGGTGLTNATAKAHLYAGGSYVRLLTGATNWYSSNHWEYDTLTQTGASVYRQYGNSFVHLTGHASQGAGDDAAIIVYDQAGATVGWRNAFQIGGPFGQDPLGSNSGILRWMAPTNPATKAPQAQDGIDIAVGTISGNAFASRDFRVSAGAIYPFQGAITQTSAGIAVDVPNYIIGYSSISNGVPSGGIENNQVGDWYCDTTTGLIVASTALSGTTVTAAVIKRVGYAASNPGTVTVTNMSVRKGDSIVVNVSATLNNTLQLQPSGGDIIASKGSAGATGDTSGHLYIPFVAGAPTGAPANATHGIAIRYDTTNHKLWAYDNGTSTWKGIVLT